MADEVGKLIFKVETDTKEAQKGVEGFNSKMEETQKVAQETESKVSETSKGISLKWMAVVTAIGTALVKLGKEIAQATSEIQDGQAIIVKATGATGEALEGLMDSAKAVYARNEDSFEDIARAIGEINTRLGLTGTELETTTELFLDFADVTGQDVQQSIIDVTKAMNRWGLETEDIPTLLDKLTYAGQASGISVQQLTTSLTDNAGIFQSMGYSLDEAISMLMELELQGIDSNAVIMAMKKSFEDSALAGTDAKKDWEALLESITNATDETEANAIAVSVFGSKIAGDLVQALRSGNLDLTRFVGDLENCEGTLNRTAEASKTTADRIEILKHQVKLAMADVGEALVPVIEKLLPTLSNLITQIFDALSPLTPLISTVFELLSSGLQMVMDTFGPFITAIAEVIGWVSSLITKVMDAINWMNKLHSQNPEHAKETGIAVSAEEVEETPEEFMDRMRAQYGLDFEGYDPEKMGNLNKFLMGSQYVPYDGYPASLHRGEMVLNRADAERFRDLGGMYGLEQTASLPLGAELGAVNVNNQLSAVIEVDGTQLGIAVLKNIDKASQFVLR